MYSVCARALPIFRHNKYETEVEVEIRLVYILSILGSQVDNLTRMTLISKRAEIYKPLPAHEAPAHQI